MHWFFDNDRPIYVQLMEQLKIFIVSGAYLPGEKLPSVRELAIETQVNPNTMQKAFTELESYGIVYTQRTSGRFVTQDIKKIDQLRYDLAKNQVDDFVDKMKRLGFTTDQIIEYLKKKGMES